MYVSIRQLGTMVEISVEDENEIILTQEYNDIFKRFYRGSLSRKQEGAGIGLYLTRDIIEKQCGNVVVRQGKCGNKFSIMLVNG